MYVYLCFLVGSSVAREAVIGEITAMLGKKWGYGGSGLLF